MGNQVRLKDFAKAKGIGIEQLARDLNIEVVSLLQYYYGKRVLPAKHKIKLSMLYEVDASIFL